MEKIILGTVLEIRNLTTTIMILTSILSISLYKIYEGIDINTYDYIKENINVQELIKQVLDTLNIQLEAI